MLCDRQIAARPHERTLPEQPISENNRLSSAQKLATQSQTESNKQSNQNKHRQSNDLASDKGPRTNSDWIDAHATQKHTVHVDSTTEGFYDAALNEASDA